jgi:hypothetical protein
MRFVEIWRGKNEAENPLQYHYLDMIQSEKQTEVEKEVRQVVDEAMRQELELLNAVIDFYSLKLYHTCAV